MLTRRVDHREPRWATPLKYRLYDRVIVISEAIRKALLASGVPADKIACVPSAVDARAFAAGDRAHLRRVLGLRDGPPVIGVVAQLIERKGHAVLIDALPALAAAHPGLAVVFFGQGPLADDLERRAGSRGVRDSVVFAGFRDDLPALLPGLDVLVHPALAEGLGVALLQAAAAGVPVVASDAGGMPEAVEHGETGLLVPPGDPGKLAEAVIRLLGRPDEARAMGEAGRRRVAERFSVERMTAGNLAVYRALLGDDAGEAARESAAGVPAR